MTSPHSIQADAPDQHTIPLFGYAFTAAALFLIVLNIGRKLFPQDFEID